MLGVLSLGLWGCSTAETVVDTARQRLTGGYGYYRLEVDQERGELLADAASSPSGETKAYLQNILESHTQGSPPQTTTAEEQQRQQIYTEQLIRSSLQKALKAQGYYNAQVRFKPDRSKAYSGTYAVHYGARTVVDSVQVTPAEFSEYLPDSPRLTGHPLRAAQVLQLQSTLQHNIALGQCYFSLQVAHKVVLNRATHRARVVFEVQAGPQATFGAVVFSGDAGVKETYLKNQIPWQQGTCFNRDKLEQAKTNLLQSGLFAKADTILPEKPAANGMVPVEITLRERAHRTMSAGATYYTDEGPGVQLGWSHRNFLGAGEQLDVNLTASAIQQGLSSTFSKPYFLRNDQTLSLAANLSREQTDAYDETALETGASLSRDLGSHLAANTGVKLKFSEIEDTLTQDTNTFALLSFPQGVRFDNRDTPLNPTKGLNVAATVEPYIDAFGESNPFIKTTLTTAHYIPLNRTKSFLVAGKAGVGSIWGSNTANVPASERFYAGGGGTVRGFGFQEVGPKDASGQPQGGRSLVYGSLELRHRMSENWGGVVFADVANVGESAQPRLEQFAAGAGVGVRYFTGFGPIRFDLATPLNNRDTMDQHYQFYISIGQAF